MKTKIIATVLGVMAMASLTYYPNTMAYAEEVTGKTPITWTDYKAVSVTEETPMVYALVNRLSEIEHAAVKYPGNYNKKTCYGGLSTQRYGEEYPVCKKITEAFNEETGLNVNVTMDKLNSKFCQIDISTEVREPRIVATIGETATLGLGNSYYESAWKFGSGKAYWIKYDGFVHAYMKVNVLGIAKLDDYGRVTGLVYTKGTEIKQNDNVMVLVGIGNTEIGWIAPNSIDD